MLNEYNCIGRSRSAVQALFDFMPIKTLFILQKVLLTLCKTKTSKYNNQCDFTPDAKAGCCPETYSPIQVCVCKITSLEVMEEL